MKIVYQYGFAHRNEWVLVGYGNTKNDAKKEFNEKLNRLSKEEKKILKLNYRIIETQFVENEKDGL